jgi:hypothetical protein
MNKTQVLVGNLVQDQSKTVEEETIIEEEEVEEEEETTRMIDVARP